jgi:hypothetical protein
VQGHLAAQDELLTRIAEKLGLDPVPVIDIPADEKADDDPAGADTGGKNTTAGDQPG